MTPFAPTHLICWTPAGGEEQTCEVMLSRGSGPAPTEVEHRFGLDPHWRRSFDGWYCDGQRTPCGRPGLVEVMPFPPVCAEIREAAAEVVERLRRNATAIGHVQEDASSSFLATAWELACRSHDALRDLPPDESRAGLAVFSAEVRRILEGA